MKKTLRIACLGLLLPFLLSSMALAETVVEKVARTGFLTVGTRFDMIPYAYINDKGELVGYSMDVLERVRKRLESRLGRTVTLQMVEAKDPGERIQLLLSGEIDISCDTAFTWERAEVVDFSTSYGISGVHLLAKQGVDLSTPESLKGKRIAVLRNSVAGDVLKLVQPEVTIISSYGTPEEGIEALKTNKIDAIGGDGVILAGTILRDNPTAYKISPTEPYAYFGVGCMVPENNSTFLDDVNYSIVKMMQDYLTGEETTVTQLDRWFGAEGLVPIPTERLKGFFGSVIIEHAQIKPQNSQ